MGAKKYGWMVRGGSCSLDGTAEMARRGFEAIRVDDLVSEERNELIERGLLAEDGNGGSDRVGDTGVVAEYAIVPKRPPGWRRTQRRLDNERVMREFGL